MFSIKFPLLSTALCSLSKNSAIKIENSAIKCYFIALFLAKNGAVMRIQKR
jgi:hypothetical protein